jgi:hypothetical protein
MLFDCEGDRTVSNHTEHSCRRIGDQMAKYLGTLRDSHSLDGHPCGLASRLPGVILAQTQLQ